MAPFIKLTFYTLPTEIVMYVVLVHTCSYRDSATAFIHFVLSDYAEKGKKTGDAGRGKRRITYAKFCTCVR